MAGGDGGTGLEGARILVVEDEFFIALDIQLALELAGAVVVGPANTVGAALSLPRAELTAAVLDIKLGRQEVFPVAEALRAAGIPFIFCTGHGDPTRLAVDWAGVEVLRKPVAHRQLVQALTRLRQSRDGPAALAPVY